MPIMLAPMEDVFSALARAVSAVRMNCMGEIILQLSPALHRRLEAHTEVRYVIKGLGPGQPQISQFYGHAMEVVPALIGESFQFREIR